MSVEQRLAVYGSLAPGEPNHGQLDGLEGTWRKGSVRGRLFDSGWGSALGFPGIVLDDEAFEVRVSLFESADLPTHWDRLDAFEGEGYRRAVTKVMVDDETIDAYIYTLSRLPLP